VPGSRDWPGQPDAPDTPRQLRSGSPRPDSPSERSDEARPADGLAADDRPARWSRDDLRQRLERLPPGHPSSPHADDRDRSSPRENTEPYRQADAAERSFWSEKPRFLQAWADHVLRWPDERVAAAVDRSRDPAGSWRGDGGQYLNPKLHEEAKDVIVTVQQREESVTGRMKEAQRDNPCGGWLEGLEFCRKGDDRLKEKIADSLRIAPAKAPEDVIREIPDAIRYTFCFEQNSYVNGYWDVKQRLETGGYRMIYSKNHWRGDLEYKGINTRWVTEEGQRFEVQFHTDESYYAKQHVTHSTYERIRNRLTTRDERRDLEAFQREVCSWIAVPENVGSIPDYEERD
jgi:hypothetical protein